MVTIKIIRKLINFDHFNKKIIKFFEKFKDPIVLIDVGAHNGETVKLLDQILKLIKFIHLKQV